MSRSPVEYLEHMREECELVTDIVRDPSQGAFAADRIRVRAVERSLELIGHSAQLLPDAWRARHPDVPWRDIFGMRNRLAHDYLATDLNIVWAAAVDGVPAVAEAVRLLISDWSAEQAAAGHGRPDESDPTSDESE